MHYKQIIPDNIKEGVWDEATCVRRQGGFDIDKSNLPADMQYLPKGAPVYLTDEGKVKLIKTIKAYEHISGGVTSMKVYKGSAAIVGDSILGTTITEIDKSNANYDVIKTKAATPPAPVNKDESLFFAGGTDAEEGCIGLVYATVKLDDFPACSVTIQAYEIEEDTLPFSLTRNIKTALTSRHAFKL